MNKQRLTEVDNQPTKTAWFDLDKARHLFTIPGLLPSRELFHTRAGHFVVVTGNSYYAFMTSELLINFLITDSTDPTHDMLMDKVAEVYASAAEAVKQNSGDEKEVMMRKRDAVKRLKDYFESEEY